tara:strand:- start:216 stop:413 length:198 start_codon:yes stop_codon:yes gene_type:complete
LCNHKSNYILFFKKLGKPKKIPTPGAILPAVKIINTKKKSKKLSDNLIVSKKIKKKYRNKIEKKK